MKGRLCVGCDKPFTPGPRGGFLCKECKEDIRREADRIREDPLRQWEKSRRK